MTSIPATASSSAAPALTGGLSPTTKYICFSIPVVCFIAFVAERRYAREAYYRLVREDGPIEILQAILFALAAVVAALIGRHLWRYREKLVGAAFVALALGLFFVAGEEISWGQRIFGIETPAALAAANKQGEITVHNLEVFGKTVHKVFILIGLYAVAGKFLCWLFARRLMSTSWSLILVDGYVISFFVPFLSTYVTYEYLNAYIEPHYGFPLVLWQDLEQAEFFLAAGFFAFVLTKLLQLRAASKAAGVPGL